MGKWVLFTFGLGVTLLLAFTALRALDQEEIKRNLSLACVRGLVEAHNSMKEKFQIKYGKQHDFVSRRISNLQAEMNSGHISQNNFLTEILSTYLAHIPAPLRTCMTLMGPSFESCVRTSEETACQRQTGERFTMALKIAARESEGERGTLDLSKLQPQDIKRSISSSQ